MSASRAAVLPPKAEHPKFLYPSGAPVLKRSIAHGSPKAPAPSPAPGTRAPARNSAAHPKTCEMKQAFASRPPTPQTSAPASAPSLTTLSLPHRLCSARGKYCRSNTKV